MTFFEEVLDKYYVELHNSQKNGRTPENVVCYPQKKKKTFKIYST
jgi:hypothetical protein